jgi:UDP-N-acetyl-D-mannosaminuronate dehydrogenase
MGFHHSICMGTGEIGRPLYELISGVFHTLPVDPVHFPDNDLTPCDMLHICIPGDIDNFNKIVVGSALNTLAAFVVVHSTVTPGTIKFLQECLPDQIVVHAPVHGKHHNNKMKRDMLRYPKYLGVPENIPKDLEEELKQYFELVGFSDVRIVYGPENTEWLKVLATTYFGLQIAWAQDVERICDKFGLDYDKVTDFFAIQEDVRPPHYPGKIGGHCVMPNIKIIENIYDSLACKFIKDSNELKERRDED